MKCCDSQTSSVPVCSSIIFLYEADCLFFLSRPGFRESAFQPFKKETTSQDEEKADEDDSEADEMVDIEKIEDKEEDNDEGKSSSALGSLGLKPKPAV